MQVRVFWFIFIQANTIDLYSRELLPEMMMRVVATLLFFVLHIQTFSQSFFTPGAWKKYRNEFQFSIGASNCLTDLGGKDQIGRNFLQDWEISQTRFSVRAAYAYYLYSNLTWRTSINYGMINGNDNTTQEPFRHNRNLHFRSHVIEFSQSVQFLFLREAVGNRYGLKNTKGRKIGARSHSLGAYVTAGVGVFYYNPQGRYNGSWINLRKLHTEGQGLPGGPKQYKAVSVDIPLGFGIRKALSRQLGIYLEYTQHYTFTDYLDDVSTVYYNQADLLANYGPASAAMADPNLGNFTDVNGSFATAPGEQRGDKTDKDNYMFLTVGVFYKMRNQSAPYKGGKRKKIKALF